MWLLLALFRYHTHEAMYYQVMCDEGHWRGSFLAFEPLLFGHTCLESITRV